jgi:hypothetical protein
MQNSEPLLPKTEENIAELRAEFLKLTMGYIAIGILAPIYMIVNSIAIASMGETVIAGIGLGASTVSLLFFSIGS